MGRQVLGQISHCAMDFVRLDNMKIIQHDDQTLMYPIELEQQLPEQRF